VPDIDSISHNNNAETSHQEDNIEAYNSFSLLLNEFYVVAGVITVIEYYNDGSTVLVASLMKHATQRFIVVVVEENEEKKKK